MIKAGHKNNVKYRRSIVNSSILLTLTIVLMPIMGVFAQSKILTAKKDSISVKTDSLSKKNDSSYIKFLRISKDSIDTPINYNAEDSGVMIMSTKEFFLYGKAKQCIKLLN